MSARQVLRPMPICEVCWLKKHARWEPESVDSTGNILMKLKGVDLPDKVSFGSVETCSDCNKLTVAGFYEVRDSSVYFAANSSAPSFDEPQRLEEDE